MKTENHPNSSNLLHQIILVSILSVALLVGFICGSLIISKSILDAHRFQFTDTSEGYPTVFDSYTGYIFYSRGTSGLIYGPARKQINQPWQWVDYRERDVATDF
jgi:hypothetical protein